MTTETNPPEPQASAGATLHVCRYCDGLITDIEDAIPVAHELGMSGPGWTVWAHREHADLVKPDESSVRILARVLIARALGDAP